MDCALVHNPIILHHLKFDMTLYHVGILDSTLLYSWSVNNMDIILTLYIFMFIIHCTCTSYVQHYMFFRF